MKKIFVISLLILLNQFAIAQSITTNSLQTNEYCVGANLEVSYTINGDFNSENVFTAQISKDNFTTFYKIGSLKSNISRVISATIPDFLEKSNNYRIRVVSSNPIIIGNDN